MNQGTLTDFVRKSITVWLVSGATGLDSTKQETCPKSDHSPCGEKYVFVVVFLPFRQCPLVAN